MQNKTSNAIDAFVASIDWSVGDDLPCYVNEAPSDNSRFSDGDKWRDLDFLIAWYGSRETIPPNRLARATILCG
jgi:hypothetical protein